MRLSSTLGVAALLCIGTAQKLKSRNYDTADYYALHIDSNASPLQIAETLGLHHEGQLGELKDHHIFSTERHQGDLVYEALKELRRRRRKREAATYLEPLNGVLFSQKQKLKPRLQKRGPLPQHLPNTGVATSRLESPATMTADRDALQKQQDIARTLDIKDPIFHEQWHLFNTIQVGHDVNVTDVWKQGITGHNATVAIVDDGLDMYSDDLKENYFAEGSYDFNDKKAEPKPVLSDDRHGTRCAGEIAAVKNDVCGVGVAWDAKVAGIRILSAQISDADEAVAMNYAFQKNQIYSCSWGPPDDGQSMDAPGILIKRAMLNGVQNGRDKKGSIYVFASGNGAMHGDNCNFDGYTNSIYSITVGAVDRRGLHPYYSEQCCAQLVVTYSSGSGDAIHTTDVGTNQCYSNHGGTSAAAPLAAGIFALVLSVRPELTWRDLQYLSMQTAVPFDPPVQELQNAPSEGADWQTTAIGKKFSHKFGYGKLDAYAIVEAAKTFVSVKPQAWYNSAWMHIRHAIPEGAVGLASTITVTKEALKAANLERLEHITVTMNVKHTRRGDVSVELRSPENVTSHLSRTRMNDVSTEGYVDWTFMSVVHWGEPGIGNWTIVVRDELINENNGTLTDWKLTLWGEALDASRAKLLPMPTVHDDDDHDGGSTSTATAATTSVSVDTSSSSPTPIVIPTDHPDRPVNEKPSNMPVASSLTTSAAATTPTATSSVPIVATEIIAIPSSTSTPVPAPKADHFLPSFFPTFGVSKRTQIWIYGAVTIIVLFCGGVAAFFYMARRKQLRNTAREHYEFDALGDAEDTRAMLGGEAGRGKRRAGELYDAFAGDSDEDVFSGDEKDYQDEDEEDEGGTNESSEGSRGRGRAAAVDNDGQDEERSKLVGK